MVSRICCSAVRSTAFSTSGRGAVRIASVVLTIIPTMRFDSTRRSSFDQSAGPGSRARSVASSRSSSSSSWRIAARTDSIPLIRSRNMKVKYSGRSCTLRARMLTDWLMTASMSVHS